MKWLGQHIWDFISRFRSDVYLEDVSSGTIASGCNLGLDSNNKIVKAAIAADAMGSGFTVSATTDSNATTITQGDDLMFAAGTGITCETTADGTVTITNTVSDTNTNQLTEFTLTGDSGVNQTIAHGNTLDIAGGNAISTVVGATDTVTVNHDDTSSQASVNNSGSTFIQDVTLDTYGHVTGLTSVTSPTATAESNGIASFPENDFAVSEDGAVTLAAVKTTASSQKYTVTGNTDGSFQGDIVYFGGTTSMTTGAIYHYKSDGTWELADADAASTSDGLLAVALGAASNTNGMLLRGMVTLDHDPGAVGDVLFLSTTAGDCSATAPAGNGDIIRVVGYCLNASNGQIWFNPDNTYVEVSA